VDVPANPAGIERAPSPRVLDQVEEGRLRQALAACQMRRGNHIGAVLASGLREFLPLESSNPGLHAGPELDRASLAAREAMQRATAAESSGWSSG